MAKISILVPTRKRVEGFMRMYNSALETVSKESELEFCVYIDDDDQETIESGISSLPYVKATIGPRDRAALIMVPAKQATGDFIMTGSDDIIFRTKYWDIFFLTEFNKVPDKILLVFGEDGIQLGGIATAPMISREWYDTAGYFMPAHLEIRWLDDWITKVARQLKRIKYLDTVLIEHMHYSVGKSVKDGIYQEATIFNFSNQKPDIENISNAEQAALMERLTSKINGPCPLF